VTARERQRERERKGETLEGVKRQEGADGGRTGMDALEELTHLAVPVTCLPSIT
jgi:hypothetical protein